MSFDGDGTLSLRLRERTSGWTSVRAMTVQWYNGGIAVGNPAVIKHNAFGFIRNQTTQYQLVTIPKSAFAVPAGSEVDEVRFTVSGASLGFYMDNVILETTGGVISAPEVPLTQTIADARYLKLTGGALSGDLSVPAEAYGSGWNGSNEVPTKNDVYDKIETVIAGAGTGDMLGSNNLSDVDSVSTARTNLGLGTGDSPQFTAINLGAASDTTLSRTGAGDIAVEGNAVYRAGGTDVPVTDGGTGSSTASGARTNLAAAAASQAGEQISGFIASPSDKSYTIALDMKHAGTITEVTTKSASGTCTATWKINSTALGGTANSVSSTESTQSHASSNAFSAGDDIVLTVSSNSSCVDMSFTIKYTRTLA
jgi:hypothetical protein